MNFWESFCIQVLQQENLWIEEQKANKPNPLYSLANTTQHITPHISTEVQYVPGKHSCNTNTDDSIIKQIFYTPAN